MQATTEYNYLKFTSLEKTGFWDFYTLFNKNSINSSFPIVKLSEVINQRKGFITIDDSKLYKRCRVQIQGKGVVLRDEVLGKEIKTKKQQPCKTDDFLVAEIDAKVGGFGIVPQALENAIVSSHYFLFEINKNLLLPEFLSIVVKQEGFLKQVKSTGSTNYAAIRPFHVLEYKIPLPTIVEQEKLVDAYYHRLNEAEVLSKQSRDLGEEIEKYLFDKLGYQKNKNKSKNNLGKFLRILDFSSLYKWGVDQNKTSSNLSLTRSFEIKKIKELCSVSSGGTPSRTRSEYYDGTIPWIKTGEVVNDIIYDTEEKITEEAIKNSSAKIYPKDSLIIAMYGQGLTRGRTAKLGINASTNQACAVLFNIDNSIILTDFLWVYLIGEYHRLREMASGNNQPNLNAQMIKDYPVIIPPIKIQSEIVEKVKSIKSNIAKNKERLTTILLEAEQEFENTIFS